MVASDRAPSLGAESRTMLESAGLEIVLAPMHDASGKLSAAAAEAEVLISGGTVLDESDFAAMTKARFLLRPYVGYDDIDVDAATEQGILFANVPDTFVEEVANQTLALLLALNRRLAQMDRFVRSGRWFAGEKPPEVAHPIKRLSRMTLGLLGFGGIGRLVAQRARPFGFRIIAHDPYHLAPETVVGTGVTLVSREALLAESDILTPRPTEQADSRNGRRELVREDEADCCSHQHLPRTGRERTSSHRGAAERPHRGGRPRRDGGRAAESRESALHDG